MTTMTKTPGALHHIEIYVSDLEKSKRFWSWFLDLMGYKIYQTWPEGISYLHGSTYIVFVQTLDKHMIPEYHRCRTGLNHLAFWAESRQQVEEITELLRQKNINILYQDKHPYAGGSDYFAVFFEDPDRIKVELVSALD